MIKIYEIQIVQEPNIIQFFVQFTSFLFPILSNFYCFLNSFVPVVEAESMVLGLTTGVRSGIWGIAGRIVWKSILYLLNCIAETKM